MFGLLILLFKKITYEYLINTSLYGPKTSLPAFVDTRCLFCCVCVFFCVSLSRERDSNQSQVFVTSFTQTSLVYLMLVDTWSSERLWKAHKTM